MVWIFEGDRKIYIERKLDLFIDVFMDFNTIEIFERKRRDKVCYAHVDFQFDLSFPSTLPNKGK